ncbi:hypothetical protein [Bradyrhizobium lablabi]|uniref:hypothetical protein n=1 Tax=Bradyrhizobium lablabi TaxID=722472 RepID=UPI001BA91E9B|nr:hypothetical protein [Bradyrhizobium lablabi]MBR0696592.1 hypothetical protein [Bradyrhizobium lablabi]
MATTALTDAIYQNTVGNSEGFPLGVPTNWSWYKGTDGSTGDTPPSDFTAVTGWGQVYPQSGATASSNPSSSVQIANFQTWVHLTSGAWVQVQNQSTNPIDGSHFLADFSGSSAWKETTLSDGSVSVDAPKSGYNDHFWPSARGTYAAGTIDGVFVEANMKTDDPNANLVANLGADWWRSATAPYVDGFANNPSPGMSDWVKLTTDWKTLYYTSVSPQTLQANPPPPLLAGTTPTQPTTPPPPDTPTTPDIAPAVTQASASPGTGSEHAGDTITLTLGFNEAVTVTGKPTLSLNDGATATYVSGSGTSTLTFKTTVASTDTNTSALAITGVNLPSGTSIKDSSGIAANLAGAVKTFTGLQINPVLPAVSQATASPGTGTEHVGDTITLTLGFNEAVTVTGKPTLSLNDGATATYVGGSGTSALTFKTTVASTDTNTSALAIKGVNLPSGTSIKDSSGVSANLAGAVKTFTGLQIDPTPLSPTSPTSPTPPTSPSSPSVTTPVLAIADKSLSVTKGGGTVDLGVKVTTSDSNDVVTVNIRGLPRYETITDALDGQTFRGKNITLTAAQVASGLTLQSNYRGWADPVATLSLTATAKDPVTGAVATSARQTITVKDPAPATATSAPQTTTATEHPHATGTSTGSLAGHGSAPWNKHQEPVSSAATTSAPRPVNVADHSALFNQIRDLVAGGLATSTPQQPATMTDHPSTPGATTASLASQSFALLNQYLAGNTGRVDHGQIVAAVSNGPTWGQDSFLTKPQH